MNDYICIVNNVVVNVITDDGTCKDYDLLVLRSNASPTVWIGYIYNPSDGSFSPPNE